MSIADLMRRIEETERLIGVYRNANEVIVGTEDEIYSRRGLINRTTLTAAEIGETIVNILEHRLAAMRAQLKKRGSEDHGESRCPPLPSRAAPHSGGGSWSASGRYGGTASGGGGSWSATGARGGTASGGGGSWSATGARRGTASGGGGSWTARGASRR